MFELQDSKDNSFRLSRSCQPQEHAALALEGNPLQVKRLLKFCDSIALVHAYSYFFISPPKRTHTAAKFDGLAKKNNEERKSNAPQDNEHAGNLDGNGFARIDSIKPPNYQEPPLEIKAGGISRHQANMGCCTPVAVDSKPTWTEFTLEDDDGNPITDRDYILIYHDDTKHSGTDGIVRAEDIHSCNGLKTEVSVEKTIWNMSAKAGAELYVKGAASHKEGVGLIAKLQSAEVDSKPAIDGTLTFTGLSIYYAYYAELGIKEESASNPDSSKVTKRGLGGGQKTHEANRKSREALDSIRA